MSMSTRLIRLLAIAALAVFSMAQESPTIRVSTRLVQVSVIVRDKNGPVEGLKQEDFQVFDQGKERKIGLFTVASSKATAAAAAKLPPGMYTNRPERGWEPVGSATVVLIDLLNTGFRDRAFASFQLVKFLKTLEPQDRVALYLLGNGVRILHDFTDDPERLVQAVAKLRGESPRELAAALNDSPSDTGLANIDDVVNGALVQMQDLMSAQRLKTTLSALEEIGQHLLRLPGRKNLVWISGSFPRLLRGQDVGASEEDAERATRALINANVSIYPVDARGLIGMPEMLSASSSIRVSPMAEIRLPPITPSGIYTMQILAERTGGRAFFNTNDLRGALRKALEDADVTYTLGFYPDSDDLDNKYHELKVKVDRKNVDLRYRKGYFATEEKPATDKQQYESMRGAIASRLDAGGITLSVRVETIEKPQAGLQLTMALDLSTLPLEHAQDRWTGKLEMAIAQFDANDLAVAFLAAGDRLDRVLCPADQRSR